MAKGNAKLSAMPMDPDHGEWQTRDDVHQLMRTDEIHSDPKRMKRAVHRLSSTAARYSKKGSSRSRSRR